MCRKAALQTALICLLRVNRLSIVTPRLFTFSEGRMFIPTIYNGLLPIFVTILICMSRMQASSRCMNVSASVGEKEMYNYVSSANM